MGFDYQWDTWLLRAYRLPWLVIKKRPLANVQWSVGALCLYAGWFRTASNFCQMRIISKWDQSQRKRIERQFLAHLKCRLFGTAENQAGMNLLLFDWFRIALVCFSRRLHANLKQYDKNKVSHFLAPWLLLFFIYITRKRNGEFGTYISGFLTGESSYFCGQETWLSKLYREREYIRSSFEMLQELVV